MIGKEKTEILLSTESYLKWELVFVGPFGQPKADCENQIFWSHDFPLEQKWTFLCLDSVTAESI